MCSILNNQLNILLIKNQIIMRIAIRYLCFLVVMMCAGSLYSQTITGKVTDNEKMPLPGATVLVQGTKNATVTDFDGSYKLSNVATGSTLEITFVGFNTMKVVANKDVVNVSLVSSTQELNEIVVVGASVKRSDLTGAVGNMSAKKIAETPTANVVQAMQGRVSGVLITQNPTPGGSASIQIRGSNSLFAGTSPIFVVDGLIIAGGFEAINPNDVANIDVLKDASSTAIYGARGANGVVVITTKKGKRGEGKVEFDTWVGLSEFSNTMPLMNGQQIFNLRADAFANGYMDKNPGADRQAYLNNLKATGSAPNPTTGDVEPVFPQWELDAYKNGESYNWLDQITRTGVERNYNLAFSGGGDKGSHYLSFNYADQDGLLKNSGNKRFNGKINLTHDVKDWLQVGTNTTYSRIETTYIDGSAYGVALAADPLQAFDSTIPYLSWGGNTADQGLYNPIVSLTMDNLASKNHLMSTNYINIKPVDGLNLRTTLSVDIMDQANFRYDPINSGQSIRNKAHGDANHYRVSELNYQWDNTATYNRVFGKHDFNALGAISVQSNSSNYTQADARGFASDDFTYHYLGGGADKANNSIASGFVEQTLMSYTGRLNYSYDKKYFATVTFRRDGSSRFGMNNQWGNFPSVALGWDLGKEFLQSVEAINLLKLRASWGIAGNQNIANYATVSHYRPSISNNQVRFNNDGYMDNPDLKWEQQNQTNLGLDFTGFGNRLSITAEYFNTQNDDLLMIRGLTQLSGYYNMWANIGSMENKGYDFSATYKILKNQDFTWDVFGNISSAKNKVTALYGDTTVLWAKGGYTGVDIQNTGNYFVGESINNIFVYEFDKILQESDMATLDTSIYNGRKLHPGDAIVKDRNKDGKIDNNDRYVIGKMDPDFYGGFGTEFNYKGFGLNAVFSYAVGAKKFSGYQGYMSSKGMSAAHINLLNAWTPENTDTNIPRVANGSEGFGIGETSAGIEDASFLRLNTLSASYTLPSQVLEKVKLDKLRLYVTGSNLFVSTKYKGLDPETGDGFPMARTIVLGLNVSL